MRLKSPKTYIFKLKMFRAVREMETLGLQTGPSEYLR
jgi:hypothetical protein